MFFWKRKKYIRCGICNGLGKIAYGKQDDLLHLAQCPVCKGNGKLIYDYNKFGNNFKDGLNGKKKTK